MVPFWFQPFHFGSALVPAFEFWFYFGSILVLFWFHFGSILDVLGRPSGGTLEAFSERLGAPGHLQTFILSDRRLRALRQNSGSPPSLLRFPSGGPPFWRPPAPFLDALGPISTTCRSKIDRKRSKIRGARFSEVWSIMSLSSTPLAGNQTRNLSPNTGFHPRTLPNKNAAVSA